MMKKLKKHSINIFVTFLNTYDCQKIFRLRSHQLNSFTDPAILALEKYKDQTKKYDQRG